MYIAGNDLVHTQYLQTFKYFAKSGIKYHFKIISFLSRDVQIMGGFV